MLKRSVILHGSVIALVSALITAIAVSWYYERRIALYQERLRETLDHIHDLQHELDPRHEKFAH